MKVRSSSLSTTAIRLDGAVHLLTNQTNMLESRIVNRRTWGGTTVGNDDTTPSGVSSNCTFDSPDVGIQLSYINGSGAGRHATTFNASGLSSGVYFYRLHAGTFVDTKRLLLLK